MAGPYSVMRRCSYLLEKLEKAHYPSKADLKRHLEDNGEDRSDRTIDRAIETLRDKFGIEITYNPLVNGYYIDKENSVNPEALYRFLEMGKTLDLLSLSAQNPKETFQCIHFEEQGNFTGINFLQPALEAILQQRKVYFTHAPFRKESPLGYTAEPYLLKEFENRWYLVCIPEPRTELRFFGMDRIHDFEVLAETFTPNPTINAKEVFENRIGISSGEDHPQLIVFECDPGQGKYLKTLPIHHSQEVKYEDENAVVFQLYVEPNFELRRKLLALTDCIKVIQPDWIAQEIQKTLTNALKRY